MAGKTNIAWTDATINPAYGCTKVSPACANCYAERMAARMAHNPQVAHLFAGTVDDNGKWTGQVNTFPERMEQALRWKKPRRIFVGSMTDLFHESVPDEALDEIFAYMALAPQHSFQILTKRPERMREYLNSHCRDSEIQGTRDKIIEELTDKLIPDHITERWSQKEAHSGAVVETLFGWEPDIPWPLPNVWLGVTVENQEQADERIHTLLETPAAVRFVSCEPLLGPVSIEDYIGCRKNRVCPCCLGSGQDDYSECPACNGTGKFGLDWVIVGGESGHNARPMHPAWAQGLRDQCAEAGVPFFFKQWGEWAPRDHKITGGWLRSMVDKGLP